LTASSLSTNHQLVKMSPCTNSSSSCCASATCGAVKPPIDDNTASSSNTLKLAAKASLASFLSTRLSSNGDIAQDVYRAMRDEAHLLLERQMVSDALDSDPFELMRVSAGGAENEEEEVEVDDSVLLDKKKNREMIERFKNVMSVISCERTTTLEGYSSIRAVVELKNDGMMRGVSDNVRLHFTFVREPQQNDTTNNGDAKGEAALVDGADDDNHNVDVEENNSYTDNAGKRRRNDCSDKCNKRTCTQQQDETDDDEMSNDTDNNNDGFTPKTIITYKIDMSVDYGQMETLLGVDIYALGDRPSVEEAMPMMHEEDGEDENEEDVDQMSADDEGDDSNADCDDAEEGREAPNSTAQALPEGNDDFEEIEMADTDDSAQGDAGKGDRFGVFVDPQSVVGFLDRVNMNLNEQSVIYLLLTLPFYEHEWDMSGFVLSSMFNDDDDDMDEEDGTTE